MTERAICYFNHHNLHSSLHHAAQGIYDIFWSSFGTGYCGHVHFEACDPCRLDAQLSHVTRDAIHFEMWSSCALAVSRDHRVVEHRKQKQIEIPTKSFWIVAKLCACDILGLWCRGALHTEK